MIANSVNDKIKELIKELFGTESGLKVSCGMLADSLEYVRVYKSLHMCTSSSSGGKRRGNQKSPCKVYGGRRKSYEKMCKGDDL